MRLICPCCNQPAQRREKPVSDYEAERAFRALKDKGWTRDRLLAECAPTLDAIAPGMTGWLRAMPRSVEMSASAGGDSTHSFAIGGKTMTVTIGAGGSGGTFGARGSGPKTALGKR